MAAMATMRMAGSLFTCDFRVRLGIVQRANGPPAGSLRDGALGKKHACGTTTAFDDGAAVSSKRDRP
jgi:hypothetical protein